MSQNNLFIGCPICGKDMHFTKEFCEDCDEKFKNYMVLLVYNKSIFEDFANAIVSTGIYLTANRYNIIEPLDARNKTTSILKILNN